MTLNVPGGLPRVCAVRATLLLAFWLMISGWAPADLPVGLAAVVSATGVSLRLLPPQGSRLRFGSLATLAASFLRQSAVSGVDVAWRALNPNLKLKPGFVACKLRVLYVLESNAGDAAYGQERAGGVAGALSRHETARRG